MSTFASMGSLSGIKFFDLCIKGKVFALKCIHFYTKRKFNRHLNVSTFASMASLSGMEMCPPVHLGEAFWH